MNSRVQEPTRRGARATSSLRSLRWSRYWSWRPRSALELRFTAPTQSVLVRCEPGALASVVGNLIGNALKHGVEGVGRGGKVAVKVVEAGDRVRFEVEDSGPGIPAEEQKRISEPYSRLSRSGEGLGLGLATVKRIIEANGGEVGVRSSPGRGSCFWFELPRG